MRVAITGATGNVGTSVIAALADEPEVESVVGIARRTPRIRFPKTEWRVADVADADLVPLFRGADAIVHLAWAIQPSRDLAALRRTNVRGSERVFGAAADAGVPALVHASSIGAYSRGPKDRAVDESWPTDGVFPSFYSRHKAETERLLDTFEAEHPRVRVVRLRPALTFKREAASGIRRLFFGPLLPSALLDPRLVPALPNVDGLRFQAVHSYDVAQAYRLAIVGDGRGAFNVAAEPVLTLADVARVLEARPLRLPPRLLRAGAAATWRLRLQPTPPGWVDLAFAAPIMDATRARTELGWRPERSATEALSELIDGLRQRADLDTPPLARETGGPMRIRELLSGIGAR